MDKLKNKRVWVCWKYVGKDGHLTKQPYSASGKPTGTSSDHSAEWSTYDVATAALNQPEKGFDGIGFVMPKGYFLLDMDHKDTSDPLFQDVRSMFPTYAETSPSGSGFHFYGRVDIERIPTVQNDTGIKLDSKYYQKNSPLGIELYIGGLTNRFATFTSNSISAEITEITDCTAAVLSFLDKYMQRDNSLVDKDTTERQFADQFITLSEDDIPDIIDALRQQKNGERFTALFDSGTIPDGKSQSEADASLCAMIAFRAGPNPDLIDTIFRQSALYRDKWERADYRKATISSGIRACGGTFHHNLRKRPPFVVNDGKHDFVVPTFLADYIRANLKYLFVREAMRGSYQKYVYVNGCYHNYSDDMFKGAIKRFVIDFDPILLKMSIIDETYKQLITDLNHIPQTVLNADENLINFQNGLLDIRTLELQPHDPAIYSSIQIPCDWTDDPTPTPYFDSYLDTLTSGNPETQLLLLEFMGACLSNVPGYRMKKALFMYGPGDTGKSQLKRLTEKLLGDGNYTGIDLQQMEARFGTSAIYGKRLAGTSDMSFMTVNELKIFKKATGGDSLFAEFKGQDSFEFVYGGMLWFCMNELPKFGGDDGSWVFERILPVHCPNIVAPEKQDHELLDKMYAERSGIVYKAVMAFRNVIQRGYKFTETDSLKDERMNYRVENNTAIEFFKSCMQPRQKPFMSKDPYTVKRIYEAYSRWYMTNYGKGYKKTKKEFYHAIADSIGTSYDKMICLNSRGTVLRDYCPIPDVWEEYDLIGITDGDMRKWFEP